jgi:ATP-binding cassette subfamily B multidrug efflux pump
MKHLSYLNRYFWKYRGRLTMGILFIVLANVFNVYAPVIIGEGIDFLAESLTAVQSIQKDHAQEVVVDAPLTYTWVNALFGKSEEKIILTGQMDYGKTIIGIALFLGVMYFVFYILKGIFLFYQRQTIIVMSRHIEYDLKNEIFNQYQELDQAFYKRNRTGDLMNRISEDVNRVRMYLGPAIMYTINLVVLVVMCIVVMWKIDAELTLYTLSPLPFMMILIFYVSTMINKKTEKVQAQQSKLSTMVHETISGIRVLKAFGREDYYTRVFKEESDNYKSKQLDLIKTDSLFMPVIALLVGLSTILTVYVGSNKVIAGELSFGVIVQFVFYVNQLTWPFASVGWVTSLVQKAEASQARINEFLQTKPEIHSPEQSFGFENGDIHFDQVSFTYPDSGIQALKHLDFKIKKGEKIGIIGRTGSGKSTIAQLLLRMFDPTSGAISIARKDIRQMDVYSLRRNMGYVPQDVFLFSESISNNIAFGLEKTKEEDISSAAKKADVYDNILHFPNQFDTLLGERGINISGGQKQRLSIARAIIKKPEILIFDDCLSAVDTETEEKILRSLEEEMQGKTSIIISHRISSLRNVDRIFVLEKGQITEEGSHADLLLKNGIYAEMHRKQQLKTDHSQ